LHAPAIRVSLPAMKSPHVYDVDATNFEERVVQRSRTLPVLVDFWAAWCGPCRTLGPVLEAEVDRLGGQVELAKVDCDRSPELQARFEVRGIPTVKVFVDGVVVDEFVGAQPVAKIRELLGRHAPSAELARLRGAIEHAVAGRPLEAASEARALLELPSLAPELVDGAALLLARILLDRGDFSAVEPVLDRVNPRGHNSDVAEAMRRLVQLSDEVRQAGGEQALSDRLQSDQQNPELRYLLGCALGVRGALPQAFDILLDLVAGGQKSGAPRAKKALLVLFEQQAADPELVRAARRRLQLLS
jgi:putative thioredoxin